MQINNLVKNQNDPYNHNLPPKDAVYNNNQFENKHDMMKNDRSNLSNLKLIQTEPNNNNENKTNLIINNNNDNNNISKINDDKNQNDLSNLNDLSPENNQNAPINNKSKSVLFRIREAYHVSLNYNLNKSSKNQLYLAKQDYIFSRFTYSSVRNYFFYSYFIRLYQLTLVRLVITFCVVSNLQSSNNNTNNNTDKNQISKVEVFIIYFLFYVWVLFLPLVLLTYLRNHQNDLLSRKQIIKFGSLYLSYRGISKDIYAILMQIKFIAVPYVCILYSDVGDFIYFLCGFVFVYYIFFVTISKPFSKVWKVFNESLSFLL